jgi:mannose-6-phosphate isomerase-like protein (cupin superfamily)
VNECRTASVVATGVLLAIGAIGACREAASPEIPPVTTATPEGGPLATSADAGAPEAGAVRAPPVDAKVFMLPATLDAQPCTRVVVAVTKGEVTALGETLATGDVLVVTHGAPFEATGPTGPSGSIGVWAEVALPDCAATPKPTASKVVVRASAAPKLEWAGGAMSAHLDVSTTAKAPSPAPELYVGRLEGTAAVAEHEHATSWEILVAHDAKGTFVRGEGPRRVEMRLLPGMIVMIPPGVKHAWRPDPGSKLVAIQMYAPPGPEQRFVALAAADKAAVKDAGARDAH